MALPDTTARVAARSSAAANQAIDDRMRHRVAICAEEPVFIESRLRALDREWDTERVLEANAATLAFAGTALGILWDRRFLAIPVVVTGFLFQHALQGWCPPLEVIRRAGVRTAREIERERTALKALRGDFDGIGPKDAAPPRQRAERALSATA